MGAADFSRYWSSGTESLTHDMLPQAFPPFKIGREVRQPKEAPNECVLSSCPGFRDGRCRDRLELLTFQVLREQSTTTRSASPGCYKRCDPGIFSSVVSSLNGAKSPLPRFLANFADSSPMVGQTVPANTPPSSHFMFSFFE